LLGRPHINKANTKAVEKNSAGEVEAGERSELTSFDRRIYKIDRMRSFAAGVSPRRLMQQSSSLQPEH
jgi:hypothetical protein